MAVNSDAQFVTAGYSLQGMGQNLSVEAPSFFGELLRQTLTGWTLDPKTGFGTPDIEVRLEGEIFQISTKLTKPVPKRTDLIDTLNEFCLSLAYLVTAKTKNAQLLHCAAFDQDGVKSIVFGNKNAGKSSLVFEKAKQGAEILADDMLIWLPKTAEVVCIGLPLRMRRPVIGLNAYENNKPQFIAGKQIAYAQKDVFRIAQAGLSFTPDKIYQYENHELNPISFLNWPKAISAHKISDDFLHLATT
jgi:hypothetical protein